MNIKLLVVGKTDDKNLQTLIDKYSKRLSFYVNFTTEVLPDIKNIKKISKEEQKTKEGTLILSKITSADNVVLFDENGKTFSSLTFATFLQKKMNAGFKNLIFVVGGSYGFSKEVYNRANGKVSLSAMTFSHQMVRLFITEQLYRAFTILKNEPYHHQ